MPLGCTARQRIRVFCAFSAALDSLFEMCAFARTPRILNVLRADERFTSEICMSRPDAPRECAQFIVHHPRALIILD